MLSVNLHAEHQKAREDYHSQKEDSLVAKIGSASLPIFAEGAVLVYSGLGALPVITGLRWPFLVG